MPHNLSIRGETIDLDQLLKLAGLVGSGGEAKAMIQAGVVQVNGAPESRRRRTIRLGDVVTVEGEEPIHVVPREPEV